MIAQIKRHGLVIAVLCLLLAIGSFAGPFASRNSAAPPEKAGVQWEYCELTLRPATGPAATVGKYTAGLRNAKEAIRVDGDWIEMAKKLKIPIKDAEGTPQWWIARLAVLDHLGAQGWELASHRALAKDRDEIEEFLFKRRVEDRGGEK
jgi:hypothetical protein